MMQRQTIAILGGTGKEGGGLGLRWAMAGHDIILGSRNPERAIAAAEAMNRIVGQNNNVRGAINKEAVAAANIVVLTVPYAAQRSTVQEVRDSLPGKILIDATVPLVPPKVSRVRLPPEGSAVAAMQELLGSEVRVVSGFQNVSAHLLMDPNQVVQCDVLVCGDDSTAREIVIALAADAGLRGIHAGPIVNSAAVEALTSVLISINMRYKIPGSGIRITGLPDDGLSKA